MTKAEDVDPRFDPVFQRGYEGAGSASGSVAGSGSGSAAASSTPPERVPDVRTRRAARLSARESAPEPVADSAAPAPVDSPRSGGAASRAFVAGLSRTLAIAGGILIVVAVVLQFWATNQIYRGWSGDSVTVPTEIVLSNMATTLSPGILMVGLISVVTAIALQVAALAARRAERRSGDGDEDEDDDDAPDDGYIS